MPQKLLKDWAFRVGFAMSSGPSWTLQPMQRITRDKKYRIPVYVDELSVKR